MEQPSNPNHPARAARWGPWKLEPSGDLPSRKLKLLFLHGFCTSPRELRPLGTALVKRGFRSMAPLIPGHGEHYANMNSCLMEDWLEAVRLSYQALRRDGSPVAIIGYCLGGALALATARELNPRALVCLATPKTPIDQKLFPAQTEGDFPENLLSTERWVSDCQSQKARRWRTLGAHSYLTEKFLHTYHQAVAQANESLSEIRCPCLVVCAESDSVVPQEDSQRLFDELLQSEPKDFFCVAGSGHALPIDFGRRSVYQKVAEFLETVDTQNVRF